MLSPFDVCSRCLSARKPSLAVVLVFFVLLSFSVAVPYLHGQTWISAVNANATATSATITWSTVVPADTQVRYGLTTVYGNHTIIDLNLVTNHSANLSPLQPGTLYHFQVRSRDSTKAVVASVDYTFTTLPATPVLMVNPTNLSFSAQQGGSNPPSTNAFITNTGGGTLNFSIANDATWLTVSPMSGSAPATLQVAANISGLSAGVYTGHLTITAPGAANSPTVVTVSLTVTAPPSWVSLTWNASSDQHVVSYNQYRSGIQGGPYAMIASAITGLTYADQTVQSGQTYYYVTTAVDDQGHESTYSNETKAVIP